MIRYQICSGIGYHLWYYDLVQHQICSGIGYHLWYYDLVQHQICSGICYHLWYYDLVRHQICSGIGYHLWNYDLVRHQICSGVGYHLWYYDFWSSTKCNTTLRYGTTVRIFCHDTTAAILQSRLPTLIPAPNVIPLCRTIFQVANVIIMIGLLLGTVLNSVLLLSKYVYFGLLLVTAPMRFQICLSALSVPMLC